MDLLTQGVLGATLAGSAAPPRELRAGAAAGFGAGLLADADALIRSAGDPLLALEFHRHFSHALAFVPFGALLAAALLWPMLGTRLGAARLYLYALLGYCLSGVLDACTSYGTHLLWPFSEQRIALDLIAIVDPLFTLALALPLAIALRTRRRLAAMLGIGLAGAYLGLAALQQQRATGALERFAAERGHAAERMLVKPTLGNIVLWRGLYVADGMVHAAAVRAGLTARVHAGARAPLATVPGAGPQARFAALSDGWVIRHPERPAMLGDARYAMLPTALRPLWGIETDASGTLRLVTDRSMPAAERARFLELLLGR